MSVARGRGRGRNFIRRMGTNISSMGSRSRTRTAIAISQQIDLSSDSESDESSESSSSSSSSSSNNGPVIRIPLLQRVTPPASLLGPGSSSSSSSSSSSTSDSDNSDTNIRRLSSSNSNATRIISSGSENAPDSSDSDSDEPVLIEERVRVPTPRRSTRKRQRSTSASGIVPTPTPAPPPVSSSSSRSRGGAGVSQSGHSLSSLGSINEGSLTLTLLTPQQTSLLTGSGGTHNFRMDPTPRTPTTNTFECIVCLESLDAAVQIPEAAAAAAAAANNAAQGGAGASGNQGTAVGNPGAKKRILTAAEKRSAALATIDPKEICATSCGHMYHKYCIQKWFNEQGRRTCPNCRKSTAAKLIRLYPNQGQGDDQQAGASGNATTNDDDGAGTMRRRDVPQITCQNVACRELHQAYGTLCYDENAFLDMRDELQLRTAEIASLTESYDKAIRELAELRKRPNAGGVKRRRV